LGYCRAKKGTTRNYRVQGSTGGYRGTVGYWRILQGTGRYYKVLGGTTSYWEVLQDTVE